jgi:ribosomal protein S18 acetylase RimI-like enzyme
MRNMPGAEDGTADSAERISLWMDPAYRGCGLGRQLVEQIIAWAHAQQLRHLELWVTEHNSAAIDLYTRSGFRLEGECQPFPADTPLSELRMVQAL